MFEQPNWKALAEEYGSEHKSQQNQLCHMIGIPLIVLAIVQWTKWPQGSFFPWIALLLPLYYFWSWRLGLAMTLAIAILAIIAHIFLNGWSAFLLFLIGWSLQLIGHFVYEKNRPSLMHNLIHLFVGPAWIVQKIARSLFGISLW